MMNFIRGLPKSVGEAAFIDGANHWQTLFFYITNVIAGKQLPTFVYNDWALEYMV